MNRNIILNDLKSYEPINKEDDVSMWIHMFIQNEVKRMEGRLTLVSPWINFYREVEELFKYDPEVRVEFIDGDEKEIKMYVKNGYKAVALDRIMPKEKTFGNIVVKVTVIPANTPEEWSILDAFDVAFKGNHIYDHSSEKVTPFGTFRYVLFDARVVQYANDDIGDAYQIRSTLYQEICKDVFSDTAHDVHFCTSLTHNF